MAQPLSNLQRKDIENIKLVSFDADGVAIERGTQVLEKDGFLTVKSKVISESMLQKIDRLKKYVHVNFSSGRNLLYLNRMFSPVLWENASLQGENGLFTLIDGQILQQDKLSSKELEKLEDIRTQLIKYSHDAENIKGFEPKQFIISVHCHNEDPEIVDIVKKLDPEGEVVMNWVSGEAYDIYLKRFDKGTGLKFLCKHLGISTDQAMAIGNDPNDVPMVKMAGVGVTTDASKLDTHYETQRKLNLGGEELIDRLLEVLE